MRNDNVWSKFKQQLAKVGGSLSLEVAQPLLKGLAKEVIKSKYPSIDIE